MKDHAPQHPRLADHAWLRQRYVEDQASQRQIAAQAGCSRETLRRALAIAGIAIQPAGRRRTLRDLNPEQIVQLIAANGHNGAAAQLGIAPSTLYREVRRLVLLPDFVIIG